MVVDLDLRLIGLAIGEPIDGIIGYECFLPAIYEIDLAAEKIVVHDPQTYHLPDGAQWQPLVIRDRRPHAMGQIENKEPGLFMLDTGATGALAVHSPTVKKLNLLEGRKTNGSMTGGGAGAGCVPGWRHRVRTSSARPTGWPTRPSRPSATCWRCCAG